MTALSDTVRKMALSGCSLTELLEFLRSDQSFKLTPLNFMRILGESLGMPMLQSREIISMVDPDFQPIVPASEFEARWRQAIEGLGPGVRAT